jgi:hypothetical protein
MSFKEFITPDCKCPWCGHLFDRTSNTEGDQEPSEGDFTVCISCAKISVFNADRTVRKPTTAERAQMLKLPWLMQVQLGIIHVVGDKLQKQDKKRGGHH